VREYLLIPTGMEPSTSSMINPAGIIFYTWIYVGNTDMLRLPRAPF
jgi:hypothetical protein